MEKKFTDKAEVEAHEKAIVHIASLLSRPEHLDKVDMLQNRIKRKKVIIAAELCM